MATFIKTGQWEKKDIGLKRWLNLDNLIKDVIPTAIATNNIVTSKDITNIVSLTQIEYDAITTPDPTTLYVIVESV